MNIFFLIYANDYANFFYFCKRTMKNDTPKITMRSLAEELNTTPATISRALNDSPQIGDEMKKKVKELAKKYNFKPNSFASSLRLGKSKTIGIIVPFINRHFFSNIIRNIEQQVSQQGYNVMICQTDESFDKEKEYVETLINQRVSGIIIALSKYTTSGSHLRRAIKHGIKVIQVDNILESVHTSRITTKDYEGAKNTTLHLLEQGYRKIALFNGIMTSKIYQDRKKGFLDAHKELNIEPNEDLFFNNTNNREEGIKVTQRMIDQEMDFDAIFSSGDYAALGAYLTLKKNNITIPTQVGLAGFANEHFAELVTPSITSSDQHSAEIGKKSAIQILAEIDDETTPAVTISILPKLIIRESTLRDCSEIT